MENNQSLFQTIHQGIYHTQQLSFKVQQFQFFLHSILILRKLFLQHYYPLSLKTI